MIPVEAVAAAGIAVVAGGGLAVLPGEQAISPVVFEVDDFLD